MEPELEAAAPPPIVPTNNIKRARMDRGLTQAGLGKLIGISQQQIAKLEAGRARLSADAAQSIARALNVRLEDVAGVRESPRVPVIGSLSINDLIMQRGAGEPAAWEDAPPFASPHTVAFTVAGDALWPMYRAGDVVFVSEAAQPETCLGEECAVLLRTGEMLLKRVMRGSRPGRYTLHSMHGPRVMENVRLVSCRRVEFIKRGRRVQQ